MFTNFTTRSGRVFNQPRFSTCPGESLHACTIKELLHPFDYGRAGLQREQESRSEMIILESFKKSVFSYFLRAGLQREQESRSENRMIILESFKKSVFSYFLHRFPDSGVL